MFPTGLPPEDHRLSGREARSAGQGRAPRARGAAHPQQQLAAVDPLLLRGAWRVSAARHRRSALSSRVPYAPYTTIWYGHSRLSKWSVETGGPELGHEQAEPFGWPLSTSACLLRAFQPRRFRPRSAEGGKPARQMQEASRSTGRDRNCRLPVIDPSDSSWGARPAASGPGSGLGCFYLAVLGWGRRDQRVHQYPASPR